MIVEVVGMLEQHIMDLFRVTSLEGMWIGSKKGVALVFPERDGSIALVANSKVVGPWIENSLVEGLVATGVHFSLALFEGWLPSYIGRIPRLSFSKSSWIPEIASRSSWRKQRSLMGLRSKSSKREFRLTCALPPEGSWSESISTPQSVAWVTTLWSKFLLGLSLYLLRLQWESELPLFRSKSDASLPLVTSMS